MKTIWKYPLEEVSEQELLVPQNAETLTVQTQNGKPCLWFLLDGSLVREKVTVLIFGTGHDVPHQITNRNYVGTYHQADGAFIYHVFIKP